MSAIGSDKIRTYVANTLEASEGAYDIDAITRDLIAEHDLTGDLPTETVDSLDEDVFWDIVARHAR